MGKPWYRDGQWWRDHWVELVFVIISAIGAGNVWNLLGEIAKLYDENQRAFAAMGVFCFGIGALCGSITHRLARTAEREQMRHEREMERMRFEHEEVERQRKEDEERKRRESSARSWVLGLTPLEKRLILRINRDGSIVTKPMDYETFAGGFIRLQMGVEPTRVSGSGDRHSYKLTLNDFGRTAVEVGMDLLEDAERYASED
jgi:hypothetical protein